MYTTGCMENLSANKICNLLATHNQAEKNSKAVPNLSQLYAQL